VNDGGQCPWWAKPWVKPTTLQLDPIIFPNHQIGLFSKHWYKFETSMIRFSIQPSRLTANWWL